MNTHLTAKARLTAGIVASFYLGSLGLDAHAAEPTESRSKAIAALEALEKRTGKTADELLPAIEIYASMVEILAEDLESGAVTKEQLVDLKAITKNIMTAVEQDSSMDATTKLVALRSLNGGRVEELKKFLRDGIVGRYTSIQKREDDSAKAYRVAVDKEATKDEDLAKALATAKAATKNAQQGGAGQPATASESKPEGDENTKPESEPAPR
jgi:hypothetical protein